MLTATEPDGTPLLLISGLALHTKNLQSDARASLLIDGTFDLNDPLSGSRVTLIGYAKPTSSATALPRFLARHPSARGYATFTDFSMYALEIVRGHYIGGFGRIVELAVAELLTSVGDAQELIAAEAEILEHMNSDHRDAITLYATQIAGAPPGDWRMCGIDPAGIDLLHRSKAARVDFPAAVHTPAQARAALVALAKEARVRLQQTART